MGYPPRESNHLNRLMVQAGLVAKCLQHAHDFPLADRCGGPPRDQRHLYGEAHPGWSASAAAVGGLPGVVTWKGPKKDGDIW